MSGFSLLPYLTRQQDPFSAVLAGKLAAQKQRNDTVKWLANYQMALERQAMSRAAAGRAQQMHDARMKLMRAGSAAQRASSGGISIGVTQNPMGSPGRYAAEMPTWALMSGRSFLARPFDPRGVSSLYPSAELDQGLVGSFAPTGGRQRAPLENPFAPPAPSPAPSPAPASEPPISTMQGFSDAGGFATDQLDAGIDTKLASLDEDPYDGEAEDDDYPNPFSAFG